MKAYVESVINVNQVNDLLKVEELAWNSPGANVSASKLKIECRVTSGQYVSLVKINGQAAGSQFAFRFNWDEDINSLSSWDNMTSDGWTDKVHIPDGNTGFLVGVGVVPEFRGQKFKHNFNWQEQLKVSELLIAYTMERMFFNAYFENEQPVRNIIGNARVPFYHLRPDLSIEEYCDLKNDNGLPFDPVLRFHVRMGAEIIKPCLFSMEDEESLNAGCWVKYTQANYYQQWIKGRYQK
ncbi:MAG: hypothetical protein ACOYL8_04985 [Patescibacteria group bacterium]